MASDTWFRFYNTAPDHPKALMLTDWQFRAWVTLLSMASKMGGTIPDAVTMIAAALRKTPQKANDTLQVLLSAGLIDKVEGGYEPHNWTTKQFKSDVSTERVKRFRNGLKRSDETAGGNGPETETKTETERKKKAARMARFNEFWLVCPKKTGKGAAEKAWLKAQDLADADTIIAGMRGYANTCSGKDSTFIKTPAPWLNERRWEDDGVVDGGTQLTPEQIAINMDRADQLRGRGKYATWKE